MTIYLVIINDSNIIAACDTLNLANKIKQKYHLTEFVYIEEIELQTEENENIK